MERGPAIELSRKEFLKLSGAGTGLALLAGPLALGSSRARAAAAGKTAILYDATKCVGCRACQAACKCWNKLPPERNGYGGIYDNPDGLSAKTWTVIKFRESGQDGGTGWLFCRYACMHCTDASCEAVCPTGAISHQQSAVVIDQEWCVGCGYCVQACPFDVPHRDEDEGTARKCTLCIDRTTRGLRPACVEACPAGALAYGDRAELVAEGKRGVESLVAQGKPGARLYGETELGGLSVVYVLPEAASTFNFPEAPRLATNNVIARWLGGIITAGVLAAIPFWLLFKRKKGVELTAGDE